MIDGGLPQTPAVNACGDFAIFSACVRLIRVLERAV
jgi:hypothetical protein